MQRVATGFESIDDALGGLISGDNVVWLCDDPALYRSLVDGLIRSATGTGLRPLVVSFTADAAADRPDVTTIDATSRSELAAAGRLVDALERRVRADPPACLVVGDLGAVVRRWGPDTVAAFFERVCPAMLEAGVTAYWHAGPALGPAFVEHARQITQCLLDVRHDRLRVLKAEGRPDALQGITYRLRHEAETVTVDPPPAGGRLARGLTTLRRELGLSQAELADAGGVTPSAISQAESGARGLSLDTVVAIADRLGVSLDRLLSTGGSRTYRLTRHDRARTLPNSPIAALATDATTGIRVFLVQLPGSSRITPPFDHRGVSAVAPLDGLVQVELADDRPVLRAGDVLVVESGPVRAWRNLRTSAAGCYWVVRD